MLLQMSSWKEDFLKMAKGGVNIETIGAWAINLDSLAFTYKFLFLFGFADD